MADRQYWCATFKYIPEPLFAKKALDKKGFSTVSKPIDRALGARLTQISQESNYSLQKLLTAALLVILCRLYGKERIVIGVPRHNRVGKRQKRIVGMFSGVVPFIGRYQSDMSVHGATRVSRRWRSIDKYVKVMGWPTRGLALALWLAPTALH